MSYYSAVLTSAIVNIIAILSMYTLMGLTGIFSMGQAACICVGAYTTGMLAIHSQLPMAVIVLISILMGMFCALLVGFPVVKLRRDYIAMITMGFGEAIVALLNNMSNITGGANGINNIPRKMTLWLGVIVLVAVLVVTMNFKRSKYGRYCIAVKNDELSAAAMGINVAKVKLIAFVFASGITALAGSLLAYTTTYVEPTAFGFAKSIDWISFVFVGGVNSLTGTLFSGLIFCTLPEILRFADMYRIIVQCSIVLLVVNFLPNGLFGEHEFTDVFTVIKRVVANKKRGSL